MPKINLDRPADSRFVIRLARESHNCWASGGSCQNNADQVQALIQQMANAVTPTGVDPDLVVSKALTLY